MEIISADSEKVAECAGAYINSLLEKYYQKPMLILLSGGSALSILQYIHTELLGTHITLSVLDERYSPDHNINNFSQIMPTVFYRLAHMQNCAFIDTRVKDDITIGLLTRQFESSLRMWKHDNPHGIVVITQGIGVDGHTAGILPNKEDQQRFAQLFENELKWAEGYDSKDLSACPLRITVTLPFLRSMVDHSVVYVTGERKREILQTVLNSNQLNVYPASIIKEMKDVKIFTDIKS